MATSAAVSPTTPESRAEVLRDIREFYKDRERGMSAAHRKEMAAIFRTIRDQRAVLSILY